MQATDEPNVCLPLVSIVLISYNHEAFLRKSLSSVFGQTYRSIELIVVDNASTDRSRDVIDDFIREQDSTTSIVVKKVFSDENTFLTGAMFRGFADAIGAYVIFLDGDDFFLPTNVEMHIAAQMVSRIPVGATSVDMLHTRDEQIVVPTGKTISKYLISGIGRSETFWRIENLELFGDRAVALKKEDLHLVTPKMSREWVWSPTSGLCFRREMVELMFSYRPNIKAGTDNYLVRGISALTGSITIDKPVAVYRMHGGNMFSKHPPIENFVSFEKEQSITSDQEVSQEIIRCYLQNLPSLAASLETVDVFIEAVEVISRVGAGLPYDRGFSNYTIFFIETHADLIAKAFGMPTFKRWRWRYARPMDWARRSKIWPLGPADR